jgi:predicted aminopeptidase
MARTASRAELTPDQATAVDILATGGSLDDVQKATTVEAATVRAWLRDADFVAALNVRTNEVRDAHLERLRAMVPKALDTLEGLLESQDEAVRLRVASYVLKAAALDSVPWQRIDQTKPEYVRNKWQREETFNALF